jgi:hypothetical protein
MVAAITIWFNCSEGGTLSQHYRAPRANSLTHILLCALFLGSLAGGAHAAPGTQRKAVAKPDLIADFSALAQNRPRKCSGEELATRPLPGWKKDRDECAWQDRLRIRQWSPVAGEQAANCLSPQARWWASARGASGAAPAWRTRWTARSLDDESGVEKRIAVIQRAANGQWRATEWRWNPSARAATRRWQEGRWKLLAALAAGLNQQAEAGAIPRETRMLQAVWEKNLGNRAGEIAGEFWRWQAEGLCMRIDPVEPGQQQLYIPYSMDDSRLEQRSAMQLQLARRNPKAVWLTPFRLLPAQAQARGGAKFDAVWIENAELKGQLWIPTKGDGPVVRLRVNVSLPAQPGGQPSQAVLARAAQTVERELIALASRWAAEYE